MYAYRENTSSSGDRFSEIIVAYRSVRTVQIDENRSHMLWLDEMRESAANVLANGGSLGELVSTVHASESRPFQRGRMMQVVFEFGFTPPDFAQLFCATEYGGATPLQVVEQRLADRLTVARDVATLWLSSREGRAG